MHCSNVVVYGHNDQFALKALNGGNVHHKAFLSRPLNLFYHNEVQISVLMFQRAHCFSTTHKINVGGNSFNLFRCEDSGGHTLQGCCHTCCAKSIQQENKQKQNKQKQELGTCRIELKKILASVVFNQ